MTWRSAAAIQQIVLKRSITFIYLFFKHGLWAKYIIYIANHPKSITPPNTNTVLYSEKQHLDTLQRWRAHLKKLSPIAK